MALILNNSLKLNLPWNTLIAHLVQDVVCSSCLPSRMFIISLEVALINLLKDCEILIWLALVKQVFTEVANDSVHGSGKWQKTAKTVG